MFTIPSLFFLISTCEVYTPIMRYVHVFKVGVIQEDPREPTCGFFFERIALEVKGAEGRMIGNGLKKWERG